jgi:hypothetical protein
MKLVIKIDGINDSIGKYHAYWTPDLTGIYIVEWIGYLIVYLLFLDKKLL